MGGHYVMGTPQRHIQTSWGDSGAEPMAFSGLASGKERSCLPESEGDGAGQHAKLARQLHFSRQKMVGTRLVKHP